MQTINLAVWGEDKLEEKQQEILDAIKELIPEKMEEQENKEIMSNWEFIKITGTRKKEDGI